MGSAHEVVPEKVKTRVTNKRTADKHLPYTPKVLLLMAIFERGEGDLEKCWKVNASRRTLSNNKKHD